MSESSTADSMFEGLRSAVRLQRQMALDLEALRESVKAAMASARVAQAAAAEVDRANSLEDAMRRALAAVKASEEAERRLAAVEQEVKDRKEASKSNGKAFREAMAPVMAAGMPVLEDDHHTVVGIKGQARLEIVDPDLIPFQFLISVPNTAAIKSALLEGQEVAGARLVYGPPGIKIETKRETKGRKAKS